MTTSPTEPDTAPADDERAQLRALLADELGSALSWADSVQLEAVLEDPNLGAVPYYEAADIANMLRIDGQARKVEQVLTLPLLMVPHSIEKGPGDRGEADLVRKLLTLPKTAGGPVTPLRLVIAQMTSACLYRTASFENWFRRVKVDGRDRIGVHKIAYRPPTSTKVVRELRNGDYAGLQQDPWATWATDGEHDGLPIRIPASRAWTYVHGQHREPIIGTSDMEIALSAFRVKQKLRFLWFLFLEAQALPKVTVNSTTDGTGGDDATNRAARKLARLSGGGVVGLPAGTSASVLEAAGRANTLYKEAMDYLDSEMSGSILAQFADLAAAAANGTGSYALSRDQSSLFLQARTAVHREMEDAFTDNVIAPLVRWNMGPDSLARCPRLSFAPIDGPTLAEILTALPTLDGKSSIPAEFIGILIAAAANLLHEPEEKVADLVKKVTENAERAAQNAQQAQLAPLAGATTALTAAVKAKGVNTRARTDKASVRTPANRAAGAAGKPAADRPASRTR